MEIPSLELSMSDPLPLIALGAVTGGIAGKFAERAWDSASAWLRTRFGSHSEEVQRQSQANAAAFVVHVADELRKLESSGKIEADRVASNQGHPQFALLLQQSLINAAQTDDDEKHSLLGKLIAARLASPSETTLALASQLACDAIARATPRQLRLLALVSFLEGIRPRDPVSVTGYRQWLGVHLKPFSDFEFKEIDALHLVAIACVTYEPASERSLEVLLQMKANPMCIGTDLMDVPVVGLLESPWAEGLGGVRLTSVGAIVGALSFDVVTGSESGLPGWD